MSSEKSMVLELGKINKSQEKVRIFELLKQNKELWDIFTRKEEYHPFLLDCFGRFPYYISNNKNILEPIVSEFLMRNGLEIEYPENKEFAICLTHDIDEVKPSNIRILTDTASSLYHFKINDALKMPFYKIRKKSNPQWNFKAIMALEEKYEAKSSFYFMGMEKGDRDFNYKSEEMIDEMVNIIDQGWEVGLHGGHEAFNNLEVLLREKNRLERALGTDVIGYRNHYLRFQVPGTWELLEKAGFKYDTTFGYSYCVGFRNGMCHPFQPFNLNTNSEMNILEIPLAIMDETFYDSYMRLDAKAAWTLTKLIIDKTKMHNGVLTLLWHNRSMTGDKLKFYNKILNYVREANAWIASGKEIYNYWIKNI